MMISIRFAAAALVLCLTQSAYAIDSVTLTDVAANAQDRHDSGTYVTRELRAKIQAFKGAKPLRLEALFLVKEGESAPSKKFGISSTMHLQGFNVIGESELSADGAKFVQFVFELIEPSDARTLLNDLCEKETPVYLAEAAAGSAMIAL